MPGTGGASASTQAMKNKLFGHRREHPPVPGIEHIGIPDRGCFCINPNGENEDWVGGEASIGCWGLRQPEVQVAATPCNQKCPIASYPLATWGCGTCFLYEIVCNLPRQQVAETSEIGTLQGGCGNHSRLRPPAGICLANPESCSLPAPYSINYLCGPIYLSAMKPRHVEVLLRFSSAPPFQTLRGVQWLRQL